MLLLALLTMLSLSAGAEWVTTQNGKMYKTSKSPGYLTGLQKISKKKYYFNASGIMQTGWQKIDGKTYYFSKKTGQMITGWLSVNKKIYFLDKNGVKRSNCWIKIGNNRYHLNKNGVRQTGITKVGSKYYYLAKSKGGRLLYKWISNKGVRYYAHKTKGYLFKSTFFKNGSYTYFAKSDCSIATGLTVINKKYYYFDPKNGRMVTNRQVTASGNTYYIGSKGFAITGTWQKIGGKYYYYGSDGKMVVNAVVGGYLIGADGVRGSKITISGNTTGSKMAAYGIQYVGNRYVWGGTSLTNGADCSGFVYTIHKDFGITLKRVADDQMKDSKGVKILDPKDLLPGDLVFYGSVGYASHVAMYIGNGQVVHASNSKPYPEGGIKISEYDYQKPIAYVRYWK